MTSGPAADADAAQILSLWLPAAFESARLRAPAGSPLVRVTLSGAGGGDFAVRPEGQRLDVRPLAAPRPAPGHDDRPAERVRVRRAERPDVWIRQSAADFIALFRPAPELPALLPPGWTALDVLFFREEDVDLLRNVEGRILVEIEGRRRRRWALDLAFGTAGVAAGRPRSTVRIDGATYDAIRTRRAPPAEALLDGRLRVDGDRALAMQALLLVAARLARR